MTTDQYEASTDWRSIVQDYWQSYVDFVNTWGWVLWSLMAISSGIAGLAAHRVGMRPGYYLSTSSAIGLALTCLVVSSYFAIKHVRNDFLGDRLFGGDK